MSVKAYVEDARFVGITDFEASGSNLAVELNTATGTRNGQPVTPTNPVAPVLRWTQFGGGQGLLVDSQIVDGANQPLRLNLEANTLRASGTVTLSVGSFFYVQGTFVF
jgi:hypothetical protein